MKLQAGGCDVVNMKNYVAPFWICWMS